MFEQYYGVNFSGIRNTSYSLQVENGICCDHEDLPMSYTKCNKPSAMTKLVELASTSAPVAQNWSIDWGVSGYTYIKTYEPYCLWKEMSKTTSTRDGEVPTATGSTWTSVGGPVSTSGTKTGGSAGGRKVSVHTLVAVICGLLIVLSL